MGYAVELFFDEKSELIIKSLWEKLIGLNPGGSEFYINNRPHISFAVYFNSLDAEKMLARLKEYSIFKMKLILNSAGYFFTDENIIFLNMKITAELLKTHCEYHEEFKDFSSFESKYYLPEFWVPHVTIAVGLESINFIRALQILKEEFRPVEAAIEKIGLIKFRPIEYLFLKDLESV